MSRAGLEGWLEMLTLRTQEVDCDSAEDRGRTGGRGSVHGAICRCVYFVLFDCRTRLIASL